MIKETDVSRIEYDKRGFMKITLIDTGKIFDVDEAKKQIAVAHEISKGKPYIVLVDSTQSTNTPTLEAKKLVAAVEQKIREAIIIKSLGNRILGNLYLQIINRRYPCKLFNDEASAVKWLLSEADNKS